MNARIINLRTRRKQKAREDKAAKGAANAVRFGRTKAERVETEAFEDQAVRRLDGHKLVTSTREDDG